jgi:hypothetical protein
MHNMGAAHAIQPPSMQSREMSDFRENRYAPAKGYAKRAMPEECAERLN